MEDPKHRFNGRAPVQPSTPATGTRRRLSRIVHDHKGNATVQWYDAPDDQERQVFAIEDTAARRVRSLNTGSLAIETADTHNPYTRIPEGDRKRVPGQKTDLRKLSAWIKMMRALEEAKKNPDEDG